MTLTCEFIRRVDVSQVLVVAPFSNNHNRYRPSNANGFGPAVTESWTTSFPNSRVCGVWPTADLQPLSALPDKR